MTPEMQINLLTGALTWMLVKQYTNAQKLQRIETLIKIIGKKLNIET